MLATAGCRGPTREPLVTYFNGEFGLSLRYPAGWRSEQTRQDGVFYRSFLGPPAGPQMKPALSVTLLATRQETSVEDFARTYLEGNTLANSRAETRGVAQGRSYLFASPDGATRYSLLLLREEDRLYGIYAQGEAPLFERHHPLLEEIMQSLTLERLSSYPERRQPEFGFAVRLPPSWRETRRFSGGGTLLLQYASPPLAADRGGQTVHASLTLTVEPLGEDATLDDYYEGTREKLGDNFALLKHATWNDGYVDVLRTETPIAVSSVKRFCRVDRGRGYSLSFEARDDVYPRVAQWYDLIASSLKTGAEFEKP